MPQFDITFFSSLLFWSVISFGVMLLFLAKFALPRVFESLDARDRRIRDSLDEAERQRNEAEQRLVEYDAKLKAASAEAERHMEQAQQRAQRLLEDNQKKIEAETSRMLSEARQEIEREQQKAIQEVRSTAVNLAIQLTERVLERNLSDDDRTRFTDDALKEVAVFYAENRTF